MCNKRLETRRRRGNALIVAIIFLTLLFALSGALMRVVLANQQAATFHDVQYQLREMAEGKNNAAIAESLVLTERSVEKVIHSIFLKLGLTWETAVHRRVKAVILYLAESD